MTENVAFEGAGDAPPDRESALIRRGYGWRTSKRAPSLQENILGRQTVALKLVDPRV